MQSNNSVIIAAAGSGKTTDLVKKAINNSDKRILIITYTINNLNEIRRCMFNEAGCIPSNVTIQSWFSFLLTECARPYQSYLYKHRIKSIEFYHGRSAKYTSKADIANFYFKEREYIYTDKISEFACNCNSLSKGLVIKRLTEIYDCIYIDEIQDLAGYDFDFLELLIKSSIQTLLVGDNRQATFSTNYSAKYKRFRGKNIIELFKKWQNENKCSILYKTECYRCNNSICTLADSLYPDMPKTISYNKENTGHDGIFLIRRNDVYKYLKKFNPTVLRYDKRTNLNEVSAINFGASKGLTFDRVLIIPNGPINKFLKTGCISYIEKSKEKLYVAITRAKYSVSFIYNDVCALPNSIPYSF